MLALTIASIWRRPSFWVFASVLTWLAKLPCAAVGQSSLQGTVSVSKSIFVSDPQSRHRKETSSDNARTSADHLPEIGHSDEHLQEVHHLAEARLAKQGEQPLHTLAQLEETINEIRNERPANVSLYETIKSEANRTRDGEQGSMPLRGLDQNFLSLFDELWKIKNESVTALVRLDYFRNSEQSQNHALNHDNKLFKPALNNATFTHRSGQQAKSNFKNRVDQASLRLSIWFSSAQQRVQSGWDALCTRVFQKLKLPVGQSARQPQSQTIRRTDIFDNTDKPGRLEETDVKPNNTRTLEKRSLQSLDQFQDAASGCSTLTAVERDKCTSMEQQISLLLNNSFPGTLKAVADNCRLITALFTECWPQKMRELRSSLSSWNETLLQHADFPLPANFLNQASAVSPMFCGIEVRLPQYLQDRINWMWLNLCIDKKFRQDYVDNLKCLSTWNQEKAQQVCSHEYKRMQSYLTSQAETVRAIGSNFEWARANSNQRTGQTNSLQSNEATLDKSTEKSSSDEEIPGSVDQLISVNTSAREISGIAAARFGLSESELNDREVSSKMLCCMFDQFLRCVHKQAVRDCGRPGAQFVVNFMSRIGTDDMKFLCNSETKSVHRAKSAGRRSGSHEGRSPFIDGHYCSDPRIQSGLLSHPLDRAGSPASGSSSPSGSKSSSNRNRLRDKTIISHDPTFFDSENIVQSAALPSFRMDSSLVIILMLYLSFIFGNLKNHGTDVDE